MRSCEVADGEVARSRAAARRRARSRRSTVVDARQRHAGRRRRSPSGRLSTPRDDRARRSATRCRRRAGPSTTPTGTATSRARPTSGRAGRGSAPRCARRRCVISPSTHADCSKRVVAVYGNGGATPVHVEVESHVDGLGPCSPWNASAGSASATPRPLGGDAVLPQRLDAAVHVPRTRVRRRPRQRRRRDRRSGTAPSWSRTTHQRLARAARGAPSTRRRRGSGTGRAGGSRRTSRRPRRSRGTTTRPTAGRSPGGAAPRRRVSSASDSRLLGRRRARATSQNGPGFSERVGAAVDEQHRRRSSTTTRGESRNHTASAISLGSPHRSSGIGYARMRSPVTGCSSAAARERREHRARRDRVHPQRRAPTRPRAGAPCGRARASTCAYTASPSIASAIVAAPSSSPARHRSTSVGSSTGIAVAEFDEIATAARSSPAASRSWRPSRSATAPK